MSAVNAADPHWVRAESIRSLPIDPSRGTAAMAWFIASEAMIFIALFFSYFYLGHLQSAWPPDSPPRLAIPIANVCILFVGCIVLWLGGRALASGGTLRARGALAVTILLGCAFLILSAISYNNHVLTLPATTNSYSSIFYVIQGVHAAHLMLGVLMLVYALVLPQIGGAERPPHRTYFNVTLYWYFVTVVWLAVFCILILVPHHPAS